jgi:hypothetical protein
MCGRPLCVTAVAMGGLGVAPSRRRRTAPAASPGAKEEVKHVWQMTAEEKSEHKARVERVVERLAKLEKKKSDSVCAIALHCIALHLHRLR